MRAIILLSFEEVRDMGQPKGPFCQSCGMPMEKPDDFGMNADGFRNNDYCRYCFKDGSFTEPHITREQMIEKIAGMAPMMRMTEAQAREMAKGFIPRLKRWR